ncbi:hypothetical protein I79_022699 [Cricetulus griseus]|uniref:Uncharacterized protein n=1 Tax=Cricetulus griseus TaxID=10029 RepID=G3IG22_CRIGR|nr:hypothetical protein I79_022699 [Cricetulus griseus]
MVLATHPENLPVVVGLTFEVFSMSPGVGRVGKSHSQQYLTILSLARGPRQGPEPKEHY